MTLGQTGCKSQRLANVVLFEIRKVGQQLLDGPPGSQSLHDHADGHTHAPNTRLAAHDFRIHGNPAEILHVPIIAHLAAIDLRGRLVRANRSLGAFTRDPEYSAPQRGPVVPGSQKPSGRRPCRAG